MHEDIRSQPQADKHDNKRLSRCNAKSSVEKAHCGSRDD
jgi:hypothetical protein